LVDDAVDQAGSLLQQPGTESCVVPGDGHCAAETGRL
jgi:hypothetical protein